MESNQNYSDIASSHCETLAAVTVFVYLNPNPNGDPYDLLVCTYQERNPPEYYTLSGKGLTHYERDNPVEFISLG